MRRDRPGSHRWTRAALAATLVAIACLPLVSAGHAHLVTPGELRVETASLSPTLSLCQLCRLAHERALPSAELSSSRFIAPIGSTHAPAPVLPAAVDVPQQPSRAPPSDV